jgi:ubiquitin-conjugating enzyme E2 D/E
LRDNWSPGLTISKVLLSLLSLLASPNPDDPLVKSIALLLLRDPVEHDRIAAEWTRQFAL